MLMPFTGLRVPKIVFGAGTIQQLPGLMREIGPVWLVVTGGESFLGTAAARALFAACTAAGLTTHTLRVAGEPSPELIDETVAQWRGHGIAGVVGIGGGSPLDAAKAIAGLLRTGNSIMDHLEGVGPELPYAGPTTPFIAVPTTAGTGSEATKNAVITRQGAEGFKKSFRDDKLIAEYALIDPDLLATCPPALIAANGMDAFTQLLEAYVSLRANVVTDALALAGLQAAITSLPAWHAGEGDQAAHRTNMALAALLSGICLAQAGLGSVHGLAQPLGSLFPIPHGMVCGTLLAAATRINLQALRERAPDSPALVKYARIGRLLAKDDTLTDTAAQAALVDGLARWTTSLDLPPLSRWQVCREDYPRIIAQCRGSSMKTNPVVLRDDEVAQILDARLN